MSESVWWKDGIIYQIYPRSFLDSNGDGLGDLPGIISRLDYLAELGINAIWLSPFYPTPDKDFGYDVSDHTDVDPRFGTLEDIDNLIREAHNRKIKVILDLVLNHTSDQHPWFLESRSSLDNPKRDWYLWREKKNNWKAVFGGSGWEFDQLTGQYYYHMFLKEQPDLNWHNPEVQQAQLDVVRFWLDRGVDGFRLDVFNVYFKDAQFRNNPAKFGLREFDRQQHIHDTDQEEMTPFLQDLRNLLDSYKDTYAVGETFIATADLAAGYVGDKALHAAFSFDFNLSELFFPFTPAWLTKQTMKREWIFRGSLWPTNVFSNHDTPRAASRYSTSKTDTKARIAMTLLLTLRGTPFMYYGEEIGMRDIKLKRNEILDPPGKKYWPIYKGRDGCRGPMQWNSEPYAGFSSSQPWLPVHNDFLHRNVDAQGKNPDSMLQFTRKLIKIRKENPALRSGDFTPLDLKSKKVMAFIRRTDDQAILVVLNFSARMKRVNIGENLNNLKYKTLLSSNEILSNEGRTLELKPFEIRILLMDNQNKSQ